jgi:AcrR family transcriptional regulator
MVKAFTDDEKNIIKEKLMTKGIELISVYGVRKTSVEDVTKAVGISKGAFYNFFPSKEEFFFEIFEALEAEVKKKFLVEIFKEGENYKESLKNFIVDIFQFMDANAIYKFMNPEDIQYVVRNLPPEKIQEHFGKDDDFASLFFKKYSDRGILKAVDAKVISGLFRALVYMRIHKTDIGEDVFPEVMNIFLDMLVEYFVSDN